MSVDAWDSRYEAYGGCSLRDSHSVSTVLPYWYSAVMVLASSSMR